MPLAAAAAAANALREAVATGGPPLPRSVRRELARLLLADGSGRASGGHTAPPGGTGSA